MAYSPTLVSILQQTIAKRGDAPALHFKRNNEWTALTWNEVSRQVNQFAGALRRLGVSPGDRVIQFAENRYEWILADLAMQIAQAVHVPVHAPLTGAQAAYQITDSGARVVLIAGPEQAGKLAQARDRLPSDLTFIAFDPCDDVDGLPEIRRLGPLADEVDQAEGEELARRALAETTPDQLATILYTSGTTGEPKGVMLSQDNLTSNTLAALESFGLRVDDRRLNFLPLSHIFARTCDLYTWVIVGFELALAESRDTVIADCAAVHPSLLNAVPYFYDKVCRYLNEQQLADTPGAARQMLGGNIRLCASGGAALPVHVYEFFLQQEVPLVEGYGLTETSPVITLSTEEFRRQGSCGRAISGIELRVAEDGEVITRGPHVMMGYYNNPEATAEMIRDGWLYTGDLGRLDEDGYLYITGRKKEIIVTAGGKNIAPVMLESLITEDPLLLQALVIGDERNYLTALIVPDDALLAEEMQRLEIQVDTPAAALSDPRVIEMVQSRINERLAQVSRYEQVGRFVLLPRPFSIEEGELTPKLSLRRQVIQDHFAEQIESMYADVGT